MAAPGSVETTDRRVDTDRGVGGDRVAVAHLLVSTAFLALGGILTVLSLLAVTFPTTMSGTLSYGRLRPMAMTATMLGWLVLALVGAAYYVLPRVTGTMLWRPDIARAGLLLTGAVTLAGIVLVGMGWGDGIEPFSLPWWIDIPILAGLAVPLIVTIQTVRNRSEDGVYVSLWFVMAGTAWLPLLYIVGNIPNLTAVGRTLQGTSFMTGFGTLWVTAVGVGVAYYTVVRATDSPLANRQLARVGFWSLALAAFWSGPVQIAFGPAPDWLDAVGAVLTLALPVAALANTAALTATIERGWEKLAERPALHATVAGLAFMVIAGFATSIGAFRSAAALVGLTPYWDGVAYMTLFGTGGLLVAGWAYQALPAMTGRKLYSADLARRHIHLTTLGVAATGAFLILAGVVAGFSWTGGSFSGSFADIGAGWSESAGLPNVLVGLALLSGLVALAGQLLFVLLVYRTLTSGKVTEHEILVEREEA